MSPPIAPTKSIQSFDEKSYDIPKFLACSFYKELRRNSLTDLQIIRVISELMECLNCSFKYRKEGLSENSKRLLNLECMK